MRVYKALTLFVIAFFTMVSLPFHTYSVAEERVQATVIFEPETLNLKKEGRWVRVFIELPSPHLVNNINVSTVSIEGVVQASWGKVEKDRLMLKFEADQVIDFIVLHKLFHMRIIMPQENYRVELKVIGQLTDGTEFEGIGTIKVINPDMRH